MHKLATLPALNVNTIIIAVIVFVGLYGVFAGKSRLRILILSVYVGIVLASQTSAVLTPTFHSLGTEEVSLLLFGLPIAIFGLLGAFGNHHRKGSLIANALVGLMTGALIVTGGLHVLPVSQMSAIDNQSYIALNLDQYYLWVIGLCPLMALIMGWFTGERKHKEK